MGTLFVLPFISSDSTAGVNQTLRRAAFEVWRNMSTKRWHYPRNISNVSPFALYTFDATWTLIEALKKLSSEDEIPSLKKMARCFDSHLTNSSDYDANLKLTNFSGVSGRIQFSKNQSNDRVNSTSYTLSNLQDKRSSSPPEQSKLAFESVMTWSDAHCKWSNDLKKNKTLIIWPGRVTASWPTDYPVLRGGQ